MRNSQNLQSYEESDIYNTCAIEQGIRKGRQLRAAAMRNLFGRVRSSIRQR